MSLPGLRTNAQPDPMQRTAFRTSWFQPEGAVAAHVIEGVIVDYNEANWTVDVRSKFDQKTYFNIQISSPYMHYNAGEGIYVFPDVGAKCHVCLPSDGPPPYVLDFIMPMESIPQAGTDDAPAGTQSKGGDTPEVSEATFAGGRPRARPGTISVRNRDGSFVLLHRGGVLQIGSTELAQRIYIPLQNLVTDISQNYAHHNTGGSMKWFVALDESEENPPTVWRHTYRLLANDEKASVRVSIGKLRDLVQETGDAESDRQQLEIGTEDPVVCEVVVSPDGLAADTGTLEKDGSKKTVLRYFFDKKGSAFLRAEGSVYANIKEKLRLRLGDDLEVFGKKSFRLIFEGTGRIQSGDLLELTAKVIKLNGGSKPIATVGSQIKIVTTVPIPIMVAGVAGTITAGAIFSGSVSTGNPSVLA